MGGDWTMMLWWHSEHYKFLNFSFSLNSNEIPSVCLNSSGDDGEAWYTPPPGLFYRKQPLISSFFSILRYLQLFSVRPCDVLIPPARWKHNGPNRVIPSLWSFGTIGSVEWEIALGKASATSKRFWCQCCRIQGLTMCGRTDWFRNLVAFWKNDQTLQRSPDKRLPHLTHVDAFARRRNRATRR